MKRNEPPIPVRSVVCLPPWLTIASVVLCGGLMLCGLALIVHGLTFTSTGARAGWIGGGLGCFVGASGGLFGTWMDWRRRLPAPALLAHVNNDKPLLVYRWGFWPALIALAAGLALLVGSGSRTAWFSLVQIGGMFAFLSGSLEMIRRDTTKRARALFALYADGALSPEDAAAIDDARAKNPRFDAAVREFQALSDRVRRLTEGAP